MIKKLKPFILSLSIILFDQLTKFWIVKTIPENYIGFSFWGDFLEIVHVRNDAVAFSFGTSFPYILKLILFILIPLLLMGAIAYLVVSKKDYGFSLFQKWCLAGIFGGGVGNLIDRIFRSLRVVDWISVKFYGILGFERFPTWNIADGSVVISVILLIISIIHHEIKNRR